MNRYTVNFIYTDECGHNMVRSEEFLGNRLDEAVKTVKFKWASWYIKIIWAGIRLTDDM